jgi:cell division protein FtsW
MVQATVNLCAVLGLAPLTGVPLPFVSFGGSSLIVSLAAVGVLLSIGRAGLAAEPARTRARKQG